MDVFRTLIVVDAILPEVTAMAEAYTPSPALAVTVPLSSDGAALATHWGASGHMPADFVALWDLDAVGFASSAARLLGVNLTEAKAQDILDGSSMSATDVWDVLKVMDLQMVFEEE